MVTVPFIILIRQRVARCSDCHKASPGYNMKCFDSAAMLTYNLCRSTFPTPFSKHTIRVFMILPSIFRQAVHNSTRPCRCNHCCTEIYFFCLYWVLPLLYLQIVCLFLLTPNDGWIAKRDLFTMSLHRLMER